jgi:hypothetical protein
VSPVIVVFGSKRSGHLVSRQDHRNELIVEASFPHEPFNSYVREGTVGAKIGASMHFRVAMAPDELASAGLGKYATG